LAGAITVGFEHHPRLPNLVDKQTDVVKIVQRVGIIVNNNRLKKSLRARTNKFF